jgi:hypothetical protein
LGDWTISKSILAGILKLLILKRAEILKQSNFNIVHKYRAQRPSKDLTDNTIDWMYEETFSSDLVSGMPLNTDIIILFIHHRQPKHDFNPLKMQAKVCTKCSDIGMVIL